MPTTPPGGDDDHESDEADGDHDVAEPEQHVGQDEGDRPLGGARDARRPFRRQDQQEPGCDDRESGEDRLRARARLSLITNRGHARILSNRCLCGITICQVVVRIGTTCDTRPVTTGAHGCRVIAAETYLGADA